MSFKQFHTTILIVCMFVLFQGMTVLAAEAEEPLEFFQERAINMLDGEAVTIWDLPAEGSTVVGHVVSRDELTVLAHVIGRITEDSDNAEWLHVQLGDVYGYVKKDDFLTGMELQQYSLKRGVLDVTVPAETMLYEVENHSANSMLMDFIPGIIHNNVETTYQVVDIIDDAIVVAEGESLYSVDVDKVTLSISDRWLREDIIAYAMQFMDTPYVWGGTNLRKGVDCSGYLMRVYEHFGIETTRTSRTQAAAGKEIPIDEMEPGDFMFFCYPDGYIFHVAMYIGNNQILHARSAKLGIMINDMATYPDTPCKAVTFIE